MLDEQRKQAAIYGKANHQLREIEYNCRQIVSMSKYLNTLSNEIGSSDINCKKIQIYKGEIKQKLKEFACSIDEIYKILDKKIIIILSQISKILNKQLRQKQNICFKCNKYKHLINKQLNQQQNNDKIFSDTLNPRILTLQSKINQLQNNQIKLKYKISQLKNKNDILLQQFNRLSTASNKKINQLNSIISKDSINSDIQPSYKKINTPIVNLSSPNKNKKYNKINFQTDQYSYQFSSDNPSYQDQIKQQNKGLLAFGCMPAQTNKIARNNILGLPSIGDDNQRFDRDDKIRRFDILLSKLRNSQQQSTQQSHNQQMKMGKVEPVSVFSPSIIQRYQV